MMQMQSRIKDINGINRASDSSFELWGSGIRPLWSHERTSANYKHCWPKRLFLPENQGIRTGNEIIVVEHVPP